VCQRGALSSEVNAANSTSLVSMDSTKQHGTHVFDVSCRVCTGSDDNTSSAFVQRNTRADRQFVSLSKDNDSSQHAGSSSHSPRKKICLAQRLKMYSTEIQKSSTYTSMRIDDECVSEKVSNADVNVAEMSAACDVQQDNGVERLIQSSEEPVLNTPEMKTDITEWQMPAVEKPQNETSHESKNEDQQKLVLKEEPQKDNLTVTSLQCGVVEHQGDDDTRKFHSPQKVGMKNNQAAAGYVAV